MKNIKTSVLVVLGCSILGIALVVFLAVSIVPQALVTMSRASSAGTISVSNSYIIGEKILANSDGIDKCKVGVFLVDADGRGVHGKAVVLTGMDSITPVSAMTDSDGKASFEMISTEDGQFVLSASASGAKIPKTLTVTFRKE